jgi:nitrite reductase/ring-hydroxylating ferredoxin subunit
MTELTASTFRTIAPFGAVSNDHVIPCYLADRRARISIARVEDRLYAFDDICTCAAEGCPLSGGLLSGTTITCQCHGSVFDITTGAANSGPATKALQVYDVQEAEDGIQIRT